MYWAPAPGAVAYDIYKNMIYEGSTIGTVYTICRDNYYDIDDYYVIGFRRDENGDEVFGPPSEALTVQWAWDWDLDDPWSGWILDLYYEGIVGFADFGQFARDWGSSNSRSDSDGDGAVGWSDFGSFVRSYAQCNIRPEMYQWSKIVVPCG